MNRHTPGPWRVGSWYDGRLAITVADTADYSIIAELTGGKRNHMANAALIAAAPELLGALEKLDLECSTDPLNPCWDNRTDDAPRKHWGEGDACPNCCARYAIAKANGEAK